MKAELIQKIQSGYKLLYEKDAYAQAEILRKFKALDISVNNASFSHVIRNNDVVGLSTLKKIGKGIDTIVDSEMGMIYEGKGKWSKRKNLPDDWEAVIIAQSYEKDFIFYPEGRWSLEKKIEFMNNTEHEFIEVGVRLNTFCNYFYTRSDSEFKIKITDLLKRGVDVKMYMLEPNSNEALHYFNDRKVVQEDEAKSIEVMKEVKQKLIRIVQEYKKMELKGKFELYTYKHLPYNHFFIVDGDSNYGKMLVSHYIYGIRRANCPVLEIHKVKDSNLFDRYWKSFKLLTQNASLKE